MELRIFITNPFTAAEAQTIQQAIAGVREQVDFKNLPIAKLDAIVFKAPSDIVVHGNAFYDGVIEIFIDPTARPDQIEEHLPATLYHEIHHKARMKTVGYGETLEETIASEGLAIHMEEEMTSSAPSYAKSLNAGDFEKVLARFTKERASTEFNHDEWFWGSWLSA